MPFVRCRFYTESGEPVRGGCHRKGAGCAFIHPDDPDWNIAPPPSFKARDSRGDSGGFRSRGGARGITAPSVNPGVSSADTTDGRGDGGGWGTGSGWGDGSSWGTGNGWGVKSGWGDGSGWGETGGTGSGWGSSSAANQVPEPAQPKSPSTTKFRDTSTLASEHDQTDAAFSATGNMKSSGHDWGGSWNGGWGTGWGDNSKDTTKSWGSPEPMIVDKPAGETERNRLKGKTVPAPPRIRIPDSEHKKNRLSGANSESLNASKWGESRNANLPTASTPVTTSTPVATMTPTDSSRVKRKRDTVLDDKSDVFKEYIKTWERGVRAQFLLAEAEAKRDRWFRTQKSACYTRIGEAGRKKLDGQRADYDKEVGLQRDKLSSAITSLVGFHDMTSSNFDLGQRYTISKDTEEFIAQSKTFVDEVRTLLVANVLKNKNDADTQRHSAGTDATLIDSVRGQVRGLEERLDQAHTELTLRNLRDIRSEIDELLSTKIAALRATRLREIDRVTSQPRAEIVIPPSAASKMEKTTQQVRELDAKVPHTVEDIRVLLLRVDATTKRVSQLEEELSTNRARYTKQIQDMATEKEETERRMDERLEKIREQFQQLVTSQGPAAQPVMSPDAVNSPERLMESLRPEFVALLDKFYEREVDPAIKTLQRVVIEASSRQHEEAIKVLWAKLQPAMNMVAGVSRWLDSQDLERTAPVPDRDR